MAPWTASSAICSWYSWASWKCFQISARVPAGSCNGKVIGWGVRSFDGKLVRNLTVSDIDRFQALIRATTGAGTSTQAKHFRVLRKCLEDARKRKYLGVNPLDEVERPKAKRGEAAYFENDELPRLWNAARDHDQPLFQLAYLTGMRAGELLVLHWRNINLTGNAIRVDQQYSEKLAAFTTPKTEAGTRNVYLSPEAIELLGRWYGQSGSPADDALVFPKKRTRNKPRRGTSVIRNLRSAMDRAGIPEVGPTGKRGFHSFRHSYAKAVLEREPPVSFKWLQGQLGHSDLKTTMDTYGHLEAATRKSGRDISRRAFKV